MPYRCANDNFGYCDTTPDWAEPPKEIQPHKEDGTPLGDPYILGGKCKLDKAACTHFVTKNTLAPGLGKGVRWQQPDTTIGPGGKEVAAATAKPNRTKKMSARRAQGEQAKLI